MGYGPWKTRSFSPYATALAPRCSRWATFCLSRGWMLPRKRREARLGSDSFAAAPSPPAARDSPAVGRALVTQIHRHGHEGAGHPGVGDNPQIGGLVPAETGEAVVRALAAIGGQLRGRVRWWGRGKVGKRLSHRSQNRLLQSLPGIRHPGRICPCVYSILSLPPARKRPPGWERMGKTSPSIAMPSRWKGGGPTPHSPPHPSPARSQMGGAAPFARPIRHGKLGASQR